MADMLKTAADWLAGLGAISLGTGAAFNWPLIPSVLSMIGQTALLNPVYDVAGLAGVYVIYEVMKKK